MEEYTVNQDLLDSYLVYTKESIAKLEKFAKTLEQSSVEDPQIRKDVFALCHDIKGMGGSFSYPLMTDAGHSICNYFRNLDSETQTDITLLNAHIKIMKNIIDNKITGSGGDLGAKITKKLNELVNLSLA